MRKEKLPQITPQDVLKAYRLGYFPMSESRDSEDVFWVLPEERGIIPLNHFHLSRSLRKKIKNNIFRVEINRDFTGMMEMCRAPATDREDSWINPQILNIYSQLHAMGHAHSVECWQDGEMVGGLYGVCLNGAFFGESMFSRVTDASKVALAHLVARLKIGNFGLLDTQFLTPHLASLGAVEVGKAAYKKLLDAALQRDSDFFQLPLHCDGSTILQSITHTS